MKNKSIFSVRFLITLLIFAAATLFVASIDSKTLEPPDGLLYGNVTRVIDGDTFIFVSDSNSKEFTVRMIGVDSPESVNPDPEKNTEAGIKASIYSKEQLEEQHVGLEFDIQVQDKYGRYLAYVWIDGVLYNKQLLDSGHATLMTVPPNIKYIDYLL